MSDFVKLVALDAAQEFVQGGGLKSDAGQAALTRMWETLRKEDQAVREGVLVFMGHMARLSQGEKCAKVGGQWHWKSEEKKKALDAIMASQESITPKERATLIDAFSLSWTYGRTDTPKLLKELEESNESHVEVFARAAAENFVLSDLKDKQAFAETTKLWKRLRGLPAQQMKAGFQSFMDQAMMMTRSPDVMERIPGGGDLMVFKSSLKKKIMQNVMDEASPELSETEREVLASALSGAEIKGELADKLERSRAQRAEEVVKKDPRHKK